jgi:hypothetical protein
MTANRRQIGHKKAQKAQKKTEVREQRTEDGMKDRFSAPDF